MLLFVPERTFPSKSELGKHKSKLSKVNRRIHLTTENDIHYVLVTIFANITNYVWTIAEFDPTSIDYDLAPFLHVANHKIAIIVRSRQYHKFIEENEDVAMQPHYFVFNLANRDLTAFIRVLDKESFIKAASPNAPASATVNSDHLVFSKCTLETGLKTL